VLPARETVHLPALIAAEFGLSRSEARRLIEQGGGWLGERQIGTDDQDLQLCEIDGQVLRVGRGRLRRLRVGGRQ
jgi:tyrosyl-tRNA synthetase